ncbi:MAG: hypothetical protein ABIK86_02030 [candidate division WOR-3 bacterium]
MAVSADGSIYVAGRAATRGDKHRFIIVKADSSLNFSWVYDEQTDDGTEALAVTTSGNAVYATGSILNEGVNHDVQQCLTVKVDANGNEVWASTYRFPGGGDGGEHVQDSGRDNGCERLALCLHVGPRGSRRAERNSVRGLTGGTRVVDCRQRNNHAA